MKFEYFKSDKIEDGILHSIFTDRWSINVVLYIAKVDTFVQKGIIGFLAVVT